MALTFPRLRRQLVDARELKRAGRSWDLVTTHFLHPPDAGMVDVTRRLAAAVAPGGQLLVVGPAPPRVTELSAAHRSAMWLAEDLLPALPQDFERLIVEQRPRTMTHNGQPHDIEDSTLFARRRP